MLGTLYPLALDALGAGKISVGPPYFETVFVPLMAPALFLMGVGPLARWKRASLPELAVRLRWALAVSLAAGPAAAVRHGTAGTRWSASASRSRSGSSLTALLELAEKPSAQTRAHYGMVVAHIGVAVFVVGVTLVKGYESEKDVHMRPGDTVELGGYVFRLDGVSNVRRAELHAPRAATSR